jgi:peptidoglycan hydrolase-like protein with peptidoglycan-binding domain
MRVAAAVLLASVAALAASAALNGVAPSNAQISNARVPDTGAPRIVVAEAAKKGAPPPKKGGAIAKKGAPDAKKDAKNAKTAKNAKNPAKKGPDAKKGPPPPAPPPVNPYASVALAERVGIQADLAFTGFFNGLITGEFSDRAMAAVRAFQKSGGFRETGLLAPPERAALAARSKAKQEQVGWRMVDDRVTGAQLGLPTAQVPNATPGQRGTRWSSAQGQVQVETFRIREPGTTLSDVYSRQKAEPAGRRLEVNVLRSDYFILSGMQGLKKFYVRAEVKDAEVRGMTILWDQATEGIMDPVVVVMSSAFAPFPGSGSSNIASLIGPPPRRKVDYGTGIVVSATGHILADRQVVDGCNVIQVSGQGDADVIAEDAGAGLTLLRVYGASDLMPAALAQNSTSGGARGGELTLVGIADPQAQAGGRAATTVVARLSGDSLQPVPQLGFAGAAALDGQGRLAGMVALKTPVLLASAGAAILPPQATLVPVEAMRNFLAAQGVTPASGGSGADAVKATLVRLICVRR